MASGIEARQSVYNIKAEPAAIRPSGSGNSLKWRQKGSVLHAGPGALFQLHCFITLLIFVIFREGCLLYFLLQVLILPTI